jgi:hypothetical protein
MKHKQVVKNNRKLSLRRLLTYVGLSLGAVVFVVAVLLLVFGGAMLNSYIQGRVERVVAEALPGSTLRIGELDYSIGANRVVAKSVVLSTTNSTLTVDRISLTGVRWTEFLSKKIALADVFAHASLEATNLIAEFPQSQYEIHCERLRASVPNSELVAEETELRASVGDEEFFAARDFRRTRFQVVVQECKVLGLAYDELLQRKSYRAQSVQISRPSFDALVNRDKPRKPFVKSPLMVHEALAALRQPLQIDSLNITDGNLRYCERLVKGADPAVLTFGAVNMFVEGIANRAEANAAVLLRAQGDLMNAGTMKVLMSIPLTPSGFSLHYSGSLSAMDLTRLNPLLEIGEHIRIKSGRAQKVTFEIDVTASQAHGSVRAIYSDLEIAVLDKETGTAKGWDNRIASFMANVFKIRSAITPDSSGSNKEGEVSHTRKPEEAFLRFLWVALRSGVLDVIKY